MNNEIKEILETLNGIASGDWIQMLPKEANKLLDYITNLQNENDDLKNRLENAVADCYLRLQENEDYKSRVEKAVEYINKNKKVVSKYEAKDTRLPLDTFMWGVDNLLNILQNGSESK
jgi:nitrate/nitrite-specific signal transduction histidine kinase